MIHPTHNKIMVVFGISLGFLKIKNKWDEFRIKFLKFY